MTPKLLIINASSPFFFYIPMGSFGVCDYLEKHGIRTRLFNPALYPDSRAGALLEEQLDTFSPTHVALVFHWQETAHGMLELIRRIKRRDQQTRIIVGGFSAGYFAEDLLSSRPEIEIVIQGDPEEPLRQYLQGAELETIPNIVFRRHGEVRSSDRKWLIEQDTLNRISYARLDHLVDAPLYMEKINTKLGFPLFIGRGCVFNCQYCGGSRHAFKLHSHRGNPVVRSVKAVIDDLHRLKQWTDVLYICYENSTSYIISLFRAIAEDPHLRKHFTLHYGAWHLLDDEFIAAYRDAFCYTNIKPIIEFSPEVISDASRKHIKGNASYDLEPLLENCTVVGRALEQNVRIELFFSRYHPTENSEDLLLQEIRGIYRLKHDLFMAREHCIRVCYDHLSTDVASNYWHEYHQGTAVFNNFLRQKQAIDERVHYPFPVDNLCFYTPKELSLQLLTDIEALAQTLEYIERYCHEFFHILFHLLDAGWIDRLYRLIRHDTPDEEFHFGESGHTSLLRQLCASLSELEELQHLGFLGDLLDFSLKKKEAVGKNEITAEALEPETELQLIPGGFSIHQHDYLDLPGFLGRLKQAANTPLSYQRTVYLYGDNDIIALPHRAYRATFQYFEQEGGTRAGFERVLAGEMDRKTAVRFLELMERLIRSGVLQPVRES